ncbi:MAG TPA: hypothetical protein VMM84_08625 [Pyrinomonadaceae bacterium]|nr:hypothetical protein [Pyrinomonadaceae bacterium]
MPKDNENIPLLDDGPLAPPEPQGFKLDEMVRCEQCLRANPPTRSNCLYCGEPLPLNEKTAELQRPTLRRLEKWESGYNNILIAKKEEAFSESLIAEAALLLKLDVETLAKILRASKPLPVARAATYEEALLVQRRLETFGLTTTVIPDAELSGPGRAARVRGLQIGEVGLQAAPLLDSQTPFINWKDLLILVTGRLVTRRVEVKERKGGSENEILDASELFADEAVVDLYTSSQTWRMTANSFDFSCLADEKTLIAGENFSRMLRLLGRQAPQAVFDDSYNSLRAALEAVWPAEQQVESRGWRRERPGKVSIGAAAETSNELQFSRYSRLAFYFCTKPSERTE